MSDAADRTIPATPRRRELARRRGLAPQAHLPGWVAVLATTVLLLPAWAAATLPAATAMMRRAVVAAIAGAPLDLDLLLPAALVMPTALVVAAAAAAGLAVRFLLDGSGWLPEPLRKTDVGAPADEASGETDALPAFLAEVTENRDESDEAISNPEEPQPHAIAAE